MDLSRYLDVVLSVHEPVEFTRAAKSVASYLLNTSPRAPNSLSCSQSRVKEIRPNLSPNMPKNVTYLSIESHLTQELKHASLSLTT